MSLRPLLDQLQHTIKSRKHKTFRFHLWTMEDLGLAYVSTPKVASNAIRGLIRQHQAKKIFNHDEEIRHNKDFKAKLDKKLKRSLKPSQVERVKGDLYISSPLSETRWLASTPAIATRWLMRRNVASDALLARMALTSA